jgi:hypothetical protein
MTGGWYWTDSWRGKLQEIDIIRSRYFPISRTSYCIWRKICTRQMEQVLVLVDCKTLVKLLYLHVMEYLASDDRKVYPTEDQKGVRK